MQIADEVPEGSGQIGDEAEGFRCRWLMRFRRVPVQMAHDVLESSGTDSQKLSKMFQAVGDNT